MLRRLALALLPLLAGCASPSPEYLGIEPQRRVVEGTEILVWQRGDRAQAIRMGRVGPGGHGPVMARMVAATEDVTGCAVRPDDTHGDSGVLNMRLDC
jgi:hypothetical protein